MRPSPTAPLPGRRDVADVTQTLTPAPTPPSTPVAGRRGVDADLGYDVRASPRRPRAGPATRGETAMTYCLGITHPRGPGAGLRLPDERRLRPGERLPEDAHVRRRRASGSSSSWPAAACRARSRSSRSCGRDFEQGAGPGRRRHLLRRRPGRRRAGPPGLGARPPGAGAGRLQVQRPPHPRRPDPRRAARPLHDLPPGQPAPRQRGLARSSRSASASTAGRSSTAASATTGPRSTTPRGTP